MQIPSLHTPGDTCQGFRRTHRLRASFIPCCVHQISSCVNGTGTSHVNRSWKKENLCMIFNSFVIPCHWQDHTSVIYCTLGQMRGVTEKSFSITGNYMYLNEGLGLSIPIIFLTQLIPWLAAIFHFDFLAPFWAKCGSEKCLWIQLKLDWYRSWNLTVGYVFVLPEVFFISLPKWKDKFLSFWLPESFKEQAYYCWVTNAA